MMTAEVGLELVSYYLDGNNGQILPYYKNGSIREQADIEIQFQMQSIDGSSFCVKIVV